MIRLVVFSLMVMMCYGAASSGGKRAKTDPNDNKGNTPFFLQDPNDETCLGPEGFTVCDERALWVLTRRPGKKTYSVVSLLKPSKQGACLERKSWSNKLGLGQCNKDGSKTWSFDFVDQSHVKLSSKGQCVVRGKVNYRNSKKAYRNSMSMQNCKKNEFVTLKYHPTAVHESGFYLKAADGACFNGQTFGRCETMRASQIMWGVGIKYLGGKDNRYFFNFAPSERKKCIVAKGYTVDRGDCTSSGALKWGLESDGRLSVNNGKLCVARLMSNEAVLAPCSENFEFVTMDVPSANAE